MLNNCEERILCFRKELLRAYSSQKFFLDSFLWDRILKSLVALPRSRVEQDYQYKQLVAYVVIKTDELYLTYRRTKKGGESRLWKSYSLGVGGHINLDDKEQLTLFGSNQNKGMDFFTKAIWRELREELTIPTHTSGEPKLIGFVNDDSNDVGKVHFGLVWLLETNISYPLKGKKGLTELKFYDIESLKTKKPLFETWSQLVIDRISRLKAS
ncbi:hypothetical protein KAI12_03090 [Candidatus Bathyarchaeota archaeon]|nr:hypothetical protein [Candidatus Bathyarchaeota archaeon]